MIWLLALILTSLAFVGLRKTPWFKLKAWWQLKKLQQHWQQQHNIAHSLQSLSHWLRQTAQAARPNRPIAGASGLRWLVILDDCGQTKAFSHGIGQCFRHAPYQHPDHLELTPEKIDALFTLCFTWLQQLQAEKHVSRIP